MPTSRKRGIKLILTIVAFIALVLLIYGLRKQIGSSIVGLKYANPFALLLITVWQTFNFHSQAHLYRSFFYVLGSEIEYKFALRTALELNFVNAVFPSGGVSGFSYFGLKMRNQGISPGRATLVQMMKFIFIFISFEILLVTGLLLLSIGGRASNLTILVAAVLTTLIIILTGLLAFIIGSKQRIESFFTFITRFINKIIHVARPAHPETINILKVQELFAELHESYMHLKKDLKQLKNPLIFALNANLAEVLTIYTVFVAFGYFINPGAVIIAYAVANFAGLMSVLPGGVGIYEGLMTGVLATAGISPALSLPVIITYRIINFSLQLPVGYIFYYRSMHPKRA